MHRFTAERLRELVAEFGVVGVTGAPNTGKTTITNAARLPGWTVVHGDDFIDAKSRNAWSGCSAAIVARACSVREPAVFEGVQIPRAMRKGLQLRALVVLELDARQAMRAKPGHLSMAKGLESVLGEVVRSPAHRGLKVFRF